MPRGRGKVKPKPKRTQQIISTDVAQKIDFKFTGKVTPAMISNAGKTTVPIFVKIDDALYKGIKRANPARTGMAEFIEIAVQEQIADLDTVLLALLEEAARQKEFSFTSTAMKLGINASVMLLDAKSFLAAKDYKRISVGKLAIACALIRADKENVIPPFEKEQQELHPST